MVIKEIVVVVLAVPQAWFVEQQSKYFLQIITLQMASLSPKAQPIAHSAFLQSFFMDDTKGNNKTSIRGEWEALDAVDYRIIMFVLASPALFYF